MGKYLIKRMLGIVFGLILVITITFVLLHAMPGGPFSREKALPEPIQAAIEEKYHLNDSIVVQYFYYMKDFLKLKLGPSYRKIGFSVNELIHSGFPNSAKVGMVTLLYIVLIGFPLGVFSSFKHNRWQDRLIMAVTTLGVTIPSFILGILIIYIFGSRLHWIPTHGLKTWKHYIGPVITIGSFSLAYVSRLIRSNMLEILQEDYIKAARARGLTEHRILFKHALTNTLIPTMAYLTPTIATILTGSFIAENIFSIPGMGSMFVESVGNRDYTVVIGATAIYALILFLMLFIADLVYSLIDPRIKLQNELRGEG